MNWACFFLCAGLPVLALLQPHLAAAAWPTDPGVNVPICNAVRNQWSGAVVSDGTGGAIIIWEDWRNDDGSFSNIDLYVQRVSAAGGVLWPTDGVALCTAVRYQRDPAIVSDGAGGAIVAWHDDRTSIYTQIYAQRVSADGVAQWAADGVALLSAFTVTGPPEIVSDGAGGAIVIWSDARAVGDDIDIYAQRVSADGVAQWAADGVALCRVITREAGISIVSDDAGGAVFAWQDRRSGNDDIYAQRVSSTGAAQWAADGVALCTAVRDQRSPAIVSDGAGGAIVRWVD
jgi:predicted lipoprotein with Yx(FWY)xxD motif